VADVASVKLRLKDFEGARKDLDASETVLDHFDSVETVVHAAFYKVNADYYQVRLALRPFLNLPAALLTRSKLQQSKLEFASYYKNALLYLACIDVEDLTQADCAARAYDLSVAALVSESIYNFGELLLHPVLDSLVETDHAWLRDLLFAFNRGDLTAYDVLAGNITKNQLLEQHKIFLYQKISLSALTETVFRRPPHDRTMTFTTISEETKVQPNEIEHLIMKALSLGLLKGSIDQVAQIAKINWVQPKVLDMKQIDGMRTRLREWDSGVNQLGHWIEGVGKDVWAA
jgi:26S proteasome regulatory subunit N9